MVKYSRHSLDVTFSALSDPTRRAILARLAQGEASVTELAEPFEVSLPAVSKHLRVLEEAGLVAQEKDGRFRRCRLVAEPMKEAAGWIALYRRFWEAQFDALEEYLLKSKKKEGQPWPPKPHPKKKRSTSGGPSNRPGRRSSGRGRSRKR